MNKENKYVCMNECALLFETVNFRFIVIGFVFVKFYVNSARVRNQSNVLRECFEVINEVLLLHFIIIALLCYYLQRNYFNRDLKQNICKVVKHAHLKALLFLLLLSDMVSCIIFCAFNVNKTDTIKTLNDKQM